MAKSNPSDFTVVSGIGDVLATLFFFPGDTIISTLIDVVPGLTRMLGVSDFDQGNTLSAILSLASWIAIVLVAKRILSKTHSPSI